MSSKRTLRLLTYLGGLTMAFCFSFPGYVNSTFLENFVGEQKVGLVFSLAALSSIILMTQIPKLLKTYGNLRLLTTVAILTSLALTLLAFARSIATVIPIFIVYYCLSFVVRYTLDVYLESISDDKNTGLIRGFYLTSLNIAWLVSPFLAGLLVASGDYQKIYIVAAISLLPIITIASFFLYEQKKISYDEKGLWYQIKRLWRGQKQDERSLRRVLSIDFLLNFFYAVMVIYMPLYLHEHLGLAWDKIGLIFTIMLVPFVLLELPLGRIADRWTGEKEILIGGLIITSLSTIILAFVSSVDWLVWAALLFATRVGAAAIEVMKEAYLFKKVDGADINLISLSRLNIPFAYLVGPIFASLVLLIFDFNYIFLCLGLLVSAGLFLAAGLKDTK